jgi:hypothetical protein
MFIKFQSEDIFWLGKPNLTFWAGHGRGNSITLKFFPFHFFVCVVVQAFKEFEI